MTGISVAVFDVDGVLLDSLGAHLQVCRDEARRLGLDLAIPDVRRFRELVAQGAVISPMAEFFHTVGFPRALADIADEHYRREFSQKYPVRPFDGVHDMLAALATTGLRLGIVTSNTRSNISAALGDAMSLFAARCVFAEDHGRRVDKSEALVQCARELAVETRAMIYVGDQPRDHAAAQQAHTRFLGVTYGWGISADDRRFPLAHSPGEVGDYLRAHARRDLDLLRV